MKDSHRPPALPSNGRPHGNAGLISLGRIVWGGELSVNDDSIIACEKLLDG